jgi:hypothetical protein
LREAFHSPGAKKRTVEALPEIIHDRQSGATSTCRRAIAYKAENVPRLAPARAGTSNGRDEHFFDPAGRHGSEPRIGFAQGCEHIPSSVDCAAIDFRRGSDFAPRLGRSGVVSPDISARASRWPRASRQSGEKEGINFCCRSSFASSATSGAGRESSARAARGRSGRRSGPRRPATEPNRPSEIR